MAAAVADITTLPFEAARVTEVLNVFYTTPSKEYREQAHSWLCGLQDSPGVWDIAVRLLTDSSAPDAAKLFAANCLQLKLQQPLLSEQPVESLESLKSFLLSQLFSQAQSPLVHQRLSCALTFLMLQMLPDMWTTPIQDLLFAQPEVLPKSQILGIIAVIPESFRRFALPVERRSNIRAYLRKEIPLVQNFLKAIVDELFSRGWDDAKVAHALFSCIEAWFDMESDIEDWAPLIFACLELDEKINNHSTSGGDFCSLYSAIAQLFICIAGNTALVQYKHLSQRVFEFAANSVKRRLCLAIAREVVEDLEVLEIQMTLSRMLATLFETHAQFFVKHWDNLTGIRETLLEALLILSVPQARYPCEEGYSTVLVPAWTNLYEDLNCTPRLAVEGEGIIVAQPGADPQTHVRESIVPYFESLVSQLITRKLKRPDATEEKEWSQETWEAFDLYRNDQSDVLMYAHRLIRDRYFESFCSLFMTQEQPSSGGGSEASSWQSLEVAFYALTSVADNPPNVGVLSTVFGNLPNWDVCQSPALANTVLQCLSKYSNAIADNKWHRLVLPCIYVCLDTELSATAHWATLAIKDILSENKDNTQEFSQAVQEVIDGGAPALLRKLYAIWQNSSLTYHDRVRGVECLGLVISTLEKGAALAIVDEMVHPRVSALEALVTGSDSAFASKDAFTDELEFLATLLGHLDWKIETRAHPHPVAQIMEKLLPLLGRLYDISNHDHEVGNKISEILKLSLLNLLDRAGYLVPNFAQVLCQLYMSSTSPNGKGSNGGPQGSEVLRKPPLLSSLCPSRHLFMIFAQDSEQVYTLSSLLATLSSAVLPFCDANYSDLIEEYVGLCRQLVKKQEIFIQFVQAETKIQMLQCAIKGLDFAEFGVLKASSQLLCEFLQLHDQLSAFVSEYGAELLLKVFSRLKSESLPSYVEYLGDVMFYLVKYYPEQIGKWRSVLPQHPLVSSMISECANKRKFKEFAKKINLMQRKGQINL